MLANTKDLRIKSKEIIETIYRGEEIILSYRGKIIAKIIPIKDQEKKSFAESSLFGLWSKRKNIDDVEGYIRKLRKGRKFNVG